MYFTHEYKLWALWDSFGLKGAWDWYVGCLIKTLHRYFTSHPFSLDVCALQKRCLYSRLPRLNPFYCTNTAWDPQFVHILNTLKDISPDSGTARSMFYVSILALPRLVRENMLLRADPTADVGVRSGAILAVVSAVMKERTGGFGSWACLFVWECRGRTSLWCSAINLAWYLSTSSQEIAIRVISMCWLICTVITAGKYWSRKNKHIIHLNLQSTAFTWQFTICNTQVYF